MQKILYVEDDLSLIDGLQYTLEASGYMVDNAKTVKEALALFRKNTYDLLLLDVTLPDGTGFDVCKAVRNSSTVPIIFLTASDQEISIVRGLDMGADDYITKPFNAEYLRISVCQMLERKEVLKDYFSSAISSFEKTDGKLTHKESKKFQQSVLKIINDHIQEKELTPRFIADHLAISVRSLYRKMEEMGEESPSIMIKECRLYVAKDLLLKTKKTIDEIVFEAGFSNKVTFFKVFREKYGCTPKEFRTKHLEEVQ